MGQKPRIEIEDGIKDVIKTLQDIFILDPVPGHIRRVYAEPVGRFGSDAMLYCDEHWSNNDGNAAVDARGMSDGSLRFLAILTALPTRPEGNLLVVEEVDNGLHPSRAQRLLRMLKEVGDKRQVDVVVTTHNPALLDAMGPAMIPLHYNRTPKSRHG